MEKQASILFNHLSIPQYSYLHPVQPAVVPIRHLLASGATCCRTPTLPTCIRCNLLSYPYATYLHPMQPVVVPLRYLLAPDATRCRTPTLPTCTRCNLLSYPYDAYLHPMQSGISPKKYHFSAVPIIKKSSQIALPDSGTPFSTAARGTYSRAKANKLPSSPMFSTMRSG